METPFGVLILSGSVLVGIFTPSAFTVMSNMFSAGASALGYIYQVRYALYILMKKGRETPSLSVSVEAIDDIAFEEEGEPRELLQLKHKVKGRANLTDSSSDLWGTVRVWAHYVRENKVNPEELIFTLVTTQTAKPGSIPGRLRPGSKRDTRKIVEDLERVADESESSTNQAAYDEFNKLSGDQKRGLVNAIRVLDNSSNVGNVTKNIKNDIDLFVDPQKRDPFYERLEGWWLDKAIEQIRKGGAISGIQYQELRHKIVSLRDQFVEDNLPADFRTPLEIEESELDPQETVFVRQLELVSVHRERIRQAIGEYYRAYKQRNKWARDGLIVDEDLEDYESRIKYEWKDYFLRMKENIPDDAEEGDKMKEGRKLYNMIRDQVDEHIKPKFNEAYHQRGSYHMLANELKVGWHRDFIQRLKDVVEEAESTQQ